MKITPKGCTEALIAALAIVSAGYVFVIEPMLKNPQGHPVDIVSVEPPEVFDPAIPNRFLIKFFKIRDDCHSPNVSRMIINPTTGETGRLDSNLQSVVQFPASDPGQPDSLEVWLWPETGEFGAGNAFMLTELCYSCPELRYCKAYPSPEFPVLDRSLDVD